MPFINGHWVNDYSQFGFGGQTQNLSGAYQGGPYATTYTPNPQMVTPNPYASQQEITGLSGGSPYAYQNNISAAAPVVPPAQKPAAAPAAQPQTGGGSFNPVGFGLGAIQTGVGLYQLNKLSKTPVPEYKASAGTLAANQRAQQNAQMGYTPSQAAAYKANLGTALNTQFANQRNLAGGNLAGALGARGTAQKLQALNQFAAGDADRQMQNIRYADEQTAGLQRMQNMNTEAAMRRRLMTEQALGAAVQQGTVNMAGAFDTGASFAKFASMMGGIG